MSDWTKAWLLLEIGFTLYLVGVAATAEEQEWRVAKKKRK